MKSATLSPIPAWTNMLSFVVIRVDFLKDTSALVDSPALGKVYQNMNIWVGNVAFDEDDMEDPVVGFKVSKEWISGNDVEPDSVVLCRYHDGE